MPSSVDAILFGAGGLVLAWTLYHVRRYTPTLAAAGLDLRWRWLQALMTVFVVGYLGAVFLALGERLDLLANLTSVIFFLGSLYVLFSVFLTRSTSKELLDLSRDLERRVEERTAQLEETNRQLREAKNEAEETNRAKSQFLANMSHEIRTPLTSILGYTDLMLRSEPDPKERLKNLQTIRRNSQHLLELINDVLDISKIEAGEMTVELLDCSPWQLVREVRSLLKSQARAKGLALEIESDGPIPETIQSDPVRLRQILLNLLGNAIKFTEAGSVRLVVGMAEQPPRGRATLSFDVVDTGVGMTADEQAGVFEPFRQASKSTVRLYGGTGLGLTISRQLAHMLGGDITVQSVPGVGSTFRLTVDAGTAGTGNLLDGPLRMETLEPMPAPAGKWWTKKIGGRVLLAEDGVDNRRFIAAVLQQAGADVTLVENGQQAVHYTLAARDQGKPYDAVLMDMQMPVLDGYAAARKLRETGYRGTIVALTAYAMSGDREKCLEAGCDDFVAKPLDVEEFLASLARFVSGSSGEGPATAGAQQDPDPPAETSVPPRDGAVLVSTLAGHPTLGTLVTIFVERLPERLGELRKAYESADLEALRRLAHGLRGAGGTYGFKPLSEAAEHLENLVLQGAARAEIDASFARLADLCRRAIGSVVKG